MRRSIIHPSSHQTLNINNLEPNRVGLLDTAHHAFGVCWEGCEGFGLWVDLQIQEQRRVSSEEGVKVRGKERKGE